MVSLLRIDNTVMLLEKRAYALQELQAMIGGNLASHTISKNPYIHIFCDDEGLMKNLHVNYTFHKYLSRQNVFYKDPIVGNVIVFESERDLLIIDGQVDPMVEE